MGAAQSTNEKVFYNDTPIEFSNDVVNQLSDHIGSPETTPERQSTLDSHIRTRIKSELEHLRQEEENIRQQIEAALEKENLDRERAAAGDVGNDEDSSIGDVKTSAALLGDIEEIRSKVDRFHSRRDLSDFATVKTASAEVTSCYKAHPTTPLECWRQVQNFKASVAQVEQEYFKSLH